MKTSRYILDGHKPVKEPNLIKWAQWFEDADRVVGIDRFENPYAKGAEDSEVIVSTVFLALDYSFGLTRTPLLFETMIFFGELDGERTRTSIWLQAEDAHATAVRRIKESIELRRTEKKVENGEA